MKPLLTHEDIAAIRRAGAHAVSDKDFRAIEAAVIEKLRQQMPVATYIGHNDEKNYGVVFELAELPYDAPLFAAPVPASDELVVAKLAAQNAKLREALKKVVVFFETPVNDRVVQPYVEVCEALALQVD